MDSAKDAAVMRTAFHIFVITLIAHALAAYAIGPVPVPWLAQLLAYYLFIWIGTKSNLKIAPGMVLLSFFFIYAMIITSYQSIVGEYYRFMPAKATTPYMLYIALRFMTIASFGAMVFATYWFLVHGWKEQIIRLLAWLCLVFSVAALYIYFAQLYGWPEPPRTRIGTTGGEQAIKFTYAFHRALGTFREPSHLAEWLVLPLLMSFSRAGKLFYAARGAGIIALLLTGSLTGMMSILFGMGAGFIFMIPFMSAEVVKSVIKIVLVSALGMSVFSLLVSSNSNKNADLIDTLSARLKPINEKGLKESNRSYVYVYLDKEHITMFGEGLGNSNLRFTQATGFDATGSFLNLFVNIELSLGYVGLATLALFLVTPFFILFMNPRYKFEPDHYLILASFFGWMIVYTVHSEEFHFHFGITYALLIHAFLQMRGTRPLVAAAV